MGTRERLGPYRLLDRIGEGGMGVVHRARDPEARIVAIKVLRSHVAGDALARQRLAREVETMRRIRSPNVAGVLDADVTGELPYVVTEYVPGRPLDQVVEREGPLRERSLSRLAAGLAHALSAIHAAGVVHRDLKPGNVMLVDGEPVIIDFGIAQAADATRLTQTGMFIGTPGYLAPEVIEGNELGPASDVHSWAATVAYAATGRSPFGSGPYEALFYRITQGQYDLAGVADPLVPFLRAALERDPRKRPKAAWLGDQVMRLASGAPVEWPSVGEPTVDQRTMVPPTQLQAGRPGQAGNGSFSDILTPVTYDEPTPPPRPAPPSPVPPDRPRVPGHHPFLTLALLAIAVGFTAMVPVIGTIVALGALVVLRAADRAARLLAERRSLRGPRSHDAALVVLGAPWGLIHGAFRTLLWVPVAGVLAVVVGVLLAYPLRGLTLNTVGAYAAAAFVGLLCAGPGSRPPRRGANRMVGAVARFRYGTLVAGLSLGFLAFLAIAGGLSQAPVWWPLTPPEEMFQGLASNAVGGFVDWLTGRR